MIDRIRLSMNTNTYSENYNKIVKDQSKKSPTPEFYIYHILQIQHESIEKIENYELHRVTSNAPWREKKLVEEFF